ncbi:MAG: hypothetical protein P9M15_00955 [Candidatus Electryoneaceae bacterium]|nr:hypothetical protein [Candidatus Electryoneaceae bacterium]
MKRQVLIVRDGNRWKAWFVDWPMLLVDADTPSGAITKLKELHVTIKNQLSWEADMVSNDKARFIQVEV